MNAWGANMATLIEVIQSAITNIPDVLTMDESIYIRGRRIAPDVAAKIAPTDDKHTENERGWYLLEIVEFIQEHVLEESTTAEDELTKLQERDWLRQDQETIEMLHEVVTSKEVSELFGVKEDTVRDACQQKQIVARKSGATWLMLRSAAKARWGNKNQ